MGQRPGRPFVILTAGVAIVSVGAALAVLVSVPGADGTIDAALGGYQAGRAYGSLTIDYPLDQTLFPPEIVPPTFRWTDAAPESNAWVVTIEFPGDEERLSFRTESPRWTPAESVWETVKRRSRACAAQVTVIGVDSARPSEIRSAAKISISTSADEVGAPIFYREVNLPFIDAVKDPSRIRWRFGSISSREQPPIVLDNLPVCGNCHSFSADGAMLGMDVDYANDKGSYAFAPVSEEIVLSGDNIITWSDFRKDDQELTFGLLSQVSPDGRYAVSTVKDRSVFVPTPELAFSQLFFPIKGILAVYDKQTGRYASLPGADDPAYVQSNPVWSPDGKYIVFARSRAHELKNDTGEVLLTKEECREFLEEGKTFLFDLYRIPFNDGAGGKAEPLTGASQNGKSNYFAKYSPDGKRIVFCQASSFMLLQPDSDLYIIPAEGGEARRLRCNTPRMNSWHSWSPNGKWLVFSSKAYSDYTQLFLTHIDDEGRSTPPVLLSHFTSPDRAANIPEFVHLAPSAIRRIREQFIDDSHFIRAGDAYMAADGDIEGAMREYRQALVVNPNNAVAHSNLGGLLVTRGKVEEGVRHLSEALRLDPENGAAFYNLGMLYFRQGRFDEAVRHLSSAVRFKPEHATARRMLGALLCNRGKLMEGITHLSEAVRLDPHDAAAQYCLGKALTSQGMLESGVTHLRVAVELEPNHAAAQHLLGQTLYRSGKLADAIAHLSAAAQMSPDDAQVLGDLAWILATAPDAALRDGEAAAVHARRACELTGFRAIAPLDTLGVSLAEAGRFSEAVWAAEQALELARGAAQDKLAGLIAERIALYENGQPYRPPELP